MRQIIIKHFEGAHGEAKEGTDEIIQDLDRIS